MPKKRPANRLPAPRANRGARSEVVKKLLGDASAKPTQKPKASKAKQEVGAPVGNRNTRDFGIYEHALIDEDEKSLFEDLSLDSLDYEIKVIRIRLRRAYKADALQHKLLSNPKTADQAFVMNKHIKTLTPEGLTVSKEKIVQDYGKVIDRLEGRLSSLIAQRNQVFIGTANENDEIARIEARRKAAVAMDRLFTIATQEEMRLSEAERGGKKG